ncbi:class I adenylate-forming enzyme family protein [Pseudoalteromonas sp. S16_S37]|uniref:class I adenylate-forming enzyme family protein n=1 Tax=Pseudoalteromonas sp. S16_S37 TaxID=2720228 RepID=UPI001680D79A|nr:class I adenylate-forming enzyme family protein [Pseudoalteromonas sp. S16_S37]MBD1584442.1 acyl--CoA ligase [Pseudoalteromonas sp. S16_S37]
MENSLVNQFKHLSSSHIAQKLALSCGSSEFTYQQLWHEVELFSQQLLENGMTKGDRVVICCGNLHQTVVSFWASLNIGGVACVISNEQVIEKIEYVINDSQSTVFVSTHEVINQLSELGADSTLKAIITIDELKAPYIDSVQSRIHSYLAQDINIEHTVPYVISEDLAAMIYTSGSTGEPKGVMMTHGNMICARDSVTEYLGNREDDVFISALPLSFDYGLYQMVMSLSIGASFILEKNMVWPLQLMKNIEKYQATVLPAVPVLVDLLKQYSSISNYSMESIRYISNTGAALGGKHFELLEELFPAAQVFSMFGLTECKRCTYLPPEYLKTKQGSVGIAIPNTEISVINEQGQLCQPHEVGQLVIRGATVMQGYWRKPEKTDEKLKIHPVYGGRCLYSGDYGYLDEDGFFYFKGRIDETLKVRGRKLIPKEVEDNILGINGVRECAIIGLTNDDAETEVYCYAVIDETMTNMDALVKDSSRVLEAFQKPDHFILLSSMPRSLNGKIDKQRLKQEQLENMQSQQKESI